MRNLALALAAVMALSGCALFDGAWDSQAERDCQNQQDPSRQSDCRDAVREVQRERDQKAR